jgi:hypothetical protein
MVRPVRAASLSRTTHRQVLSPLAGNQAENREIERPFGEDGWFLLLLQLICKCI